MKRFLPLPLLLAASLAISACGATDDGVASDGVVENDVSSPGSDQAASSVDAADSLEISDPWVAAAEDGMTAAYGELQNPTGDSVEITGVQTPASTSTELHETTLSEAGETLMREVERFTIDAGASLLLEPGGDHLMLMDLTDPLIPGDDIAFTLQLADGSSFEFTATVRDFAVGHEPYEHDDHDDGDEEHGDQEHGDDENHADEHGEDHGDGDEEERDH